MMWQSNIDESTEFEEVVVLKERLPAMQKL